VLRILYLDELRGYLRSKVVIVLMIGLPVLAVLLHALRPDAEGVPLSLFVAILISGIGGTLAAVVLSTSITSERMHGVFDLFLVRPVKRRQLLIAKYFAMLTCLTAAVVVSMGLALCVDAATVGLPVDDLGREIVQSLIIGFAAVAIACSAGVLFGTLFSNVAVSAILAVYLGNQLTGIIVLPTVLVEGFDPVLYAIAVGTALPALILTTAVIIFERKGL
jgi:ABC-2 type transport system permease protein